MNQQNKTTRTLKDTIILVLIACTIIGGFTFLAAAAEMSIQVHNSDSFAQGYSDYPNAETYDTISFPVTPMDDFDDYSYALGFKSARNDELIHLKHRDVLHA